MYFFLTCTDTVTLGIVAGVCCLGSFGTGAVFAIVVMYFSKWKSQKAVKDPVVYDYVSQPVGGVKPNNELSWSQKLLGLLIHSKKTQ